MGLIINQGMHDPEKVQDYSVIESEKELGQIIEVKPNDYIDNALSVTYKIIGDSSKYSGRLVFDTINYDPSHQMSFRYLQLREYAGVPYTKGEPADIDIEQMLMDRVVVLKLGKRPKKDAPGEFWQTVRFVKGDAPKTNGKLNGDAPVKSESVKFDNNTVSSVTPPANPSIPDVDDEW